MKKVLSLILCFLMIMTAALVFTGCSLKERSSGDFTYKKFGSKKDWYAEITGLSEQGKTKEVIIIPETIDGLPVRAIMDRYLLMVGNGDEKWASTQLTKIYLVKDMDVRAGCWQECPNLKQIIVVNTTKDNFYFVSRGAYDCANTYCFKEFYKAEILGSINQDVLNYLHAANVTYYLNYSGAPNGGCYWLDQVEAGEKITFIPLNPTRQDNRYQFYGWYTDKECTNIWDFTTCVIPESGELNLYAKWIGLGSFIQNNVDIDSVKGNEAMRYELINFDLQSKYYDDYSELSAEMEILKSNVVLRDKKAFAAYADALKTNGKTPLLMCPFLFSSTEEGVVVSDVATKDNNVYVTFDVYSPECCDADIRMYVFFIDVSGLIVNNNENLQIKYLINNLADGQGSYYYD